MTTTAISAFAPTAPCGVTSRCSRSSSSIAAQIMTNASISMRLPTRVWSRSDTTRDSSTWQERRTRQEPAGRSGVCGTARSLPLQTADYKDELIAFLGASYFRVLGRGQSYGASARGLALNVATTDGEEFPYFSDFWLVRPGPAQRTLTVYALLDSPSLAAPTDSRSARVRPRTWKSPPHSTRARMSKSSASRP